MGRVGGWVERGREWVDGRMWGWAIKRISISISILARNDHKINIIDYFCNFFFKNVLAGYISLQ